MVLLVVYRGDLNYREKQAKLTNRIGKALVIYRFGDVYVTSEIVAALDFNLVIRRRQDDHWRAVYLHDAHDLFE